MPSDKGKRKNMPWTKYFALAGFGLGMANFSLLYLMPYFFSGITISHFLASSAIFLVPPVLGMSVIPPICSFIKDTLVSSFTLKEKDKNILGISEKALGLLCKAFVFGSCVTVGLTTSSVVLGAFVMGMVTNPVISIVPSFFVASSALFVAATPLAISCAIGSSVIGIAEFFYDEAKKITTSFFKDKNAGSSKGIDQREKGDIIPVISAGRGVTEKNQIQDHSGTINYDNNRKKERTGEDIKTHKTTQDRGAL